MRASTSSRFGGGFFARSAASIAGDASTPTHGMPSAAIGSSTRPVPHPSSSTGPPVSSASAR